MHRKRDVLLWEVIGTGLLVLGVLLTNPLAGAGKPNFMAPAVVGCAIALTFERSGAHLNPLATGITRIFFKHPLRHGSFYILSEFIGVFVAVTIALWLPLSYSVQGTPGIFDYANAPKIIGLEIVASLLLMSLMSLFIILRKAKWLILFVPVFLVVLNFTPLWSMQMNPAVTVALTLVGTISSDEAVIHIIGQLIAMAIMFALAKPLSNLRRLSADRAETKATSSK